jgi:hypothetical protein
MLLLQAFKFALALLCLIATTAALRRHTISNRTTVHDDYTTTHGLNARGLKGEHSRAWPRRVSTTFLNGVLRPVRYCYANEETFRAIDCKVQAAMKLMVGSTGHQPNRSTLPLVELGNPQRSTSVLLWSRLSEPGKLWYLEQ